MVKHLAPFWCFFGGKRRAAPRYPAPTHGTIVEPFAGAAGYSTYYPWLRVVLYEADPVIYGVWDYLIRARRSEVLALPLLSAGEDVAGHTYLPQEARWLIGFWLNKGMTGPCRRLSAGAARWAEKPGQEVYWGEAVRARIASQVQHIRHWEAHNASYTQSPDLEATWFVDPPYRDRGVRYRFGSRLLDYPSLGAWCKSRRGQVMVCEHAGAGWLPFAPFGSTKAMPGPGRDGSSQEVLFYRAG